MLAPRLATEGDFMINKTYIKYWPAEYHSQSAIDAQLQEAPGYPEAMPAFVFYPWLTLRHGLIRRRGLLEWIDESLELLDRRPGPAGDDADPEAMSALVRGLAEALQWEERRVPDGGEPRVVLCGAPNAGKSALFNALVDDGEAIVSDVAGTTRDVVAGPWTLTGRRVQLLDVAGELEAAEGPDREAGRPARAARASADLLLHVVDADGGEVEPLEDAAAPVVLVWSRIDRPSAAADPPERLRRAARAWVAVSRSR